MHSLSLKLCDVVKVEEDDIVGTWWRWRRWRRWRRMIWQRRIKARSTPQHTYRQQVRLNDVEDVIGVVFERAQSLLWAE